MLDALDDGDLDRVLDLYGGPLLATSDAPAIVEQRHVIDVAVRAAVVHDGHPDRIARLAAAAPDDAYLQELVVERLAPGDPRRSIAVARLDLLAT